MRAEPLQKAPKVRLPELWVQHVTGPEMKQLSRWSSHGSFVWNMPSLGPKLQKGILKIVAKLITASPRHLGCLMRSCKCKQEQKEILNSNLEMTLSDLHCCCESLAALTQEFHLFQTSRVNGYLISVTPRLKLVTSTKDLMASISWYLFGASSMVVGGCRYPFNRRHHLLSVFTRKFQPRAMRLHHRSGSIAVSRAPGRRVFKSWMRGPTLLNSSSS